MTGATQASCRNKWLSVLLWDLKGLRGKRIAQNMGTKIGLIKLIYFVIFCAGCPDAEQMARIQHRFMLTYMERQTISERLFIITIAVIIILPVLCIITYWLLFT